MSDIVISYARPNEPQALALSDTARKRLGLGIEATSTAAAGPGEATAAT